jgi:hypothetical protein
MIRARRNVFLPVFIGTLLLSLTVAPGCCNRCHGARGIAAPPGNRADTGSAGVAVTKEVPHSKETIPEIMDRERTNPLPSRGDTAIPSHKILRTGNDDCGRTE